MSGGRGGGMECDCLFVSWSRGVRRRVSDPRHERASSSSATPHGRSFPLVWLQGLSPPSRLALSAPLPHQALLTNLPILRLLQISQTSSAKPHFVQRKSQPSPHQKTSVTLSTNHAKPLSTLFTSFNGRLVHSTGRLLRCHVRSTQHVQCVLCYSV